jgi:hypothetical protein
MVPAATDMNATIAQQQSNGVFYVVRAEMLQARRGLELPQLMARR